MQCFLRLHSLPSASIVLAGIMAHNEGDRPVCDITIVWGKKFEKGFAFREVLPICVALPALPRKAGLLIPTGFAPLPRPYPIEDRTGRVSSPPAYALWAQPA